MRRNILFAAIAVFAVGMATVQAAPVLTQAFPDMQVSSNAVSYSASTHLFTATGRPLTFTVVPPTTYNVTNTTTTSYNLSATIDSAGQAASGTLSIGGKIASLGASSGTLLTGSLLDFGYAGSSNGDPFEFVFSVTGGDLASYYGGIGGRIGVMLSAKSANFVNFASSFTSGSGATNDTFAVTPEPASLGLLMAAGMFFLRRNRR